jgi:hypothetical protein
LAEEHPELRYGIFQIGRNGLAMLAEYHELMPGAGKRALETQGSEFANKIAPLNWPPPGHF